MGDLFREEALDFQARAAEGSIRLSKPPGFRLVVIMLVAALVIAIAFAASGSYARKATVTGVVDTDLAIKRIVSPHSAVIEELLVSESQRITVGTRVARLRLASTLSDVERERRLDEYHRQLSAIDGRIGHLEQERRSERQRLETQSAHLAATIEEHQLVIKLETQKREARRDAREAALPLAEQGLISRLEWARINEAWLESEQRLTQLAADQRSRQSEVVSKQAALSQLADRYGGERLVLEQQASTIRQQIDDLAGGERIELIASTSGIVSRIYLERGQAVKAGQPVVSVKPVGAVLQARLYIPSRSAGFAAAGQRVNLLYDAFPHQQFGTHGGTLTRISEHALMPGLDTGATSREPVFEATVALDRAYVVAYGKRINLRHGMTLSADIVLERRSLLAWLLEPLRIMRGRS